jgi:tight adherence protein B
MQAGALVLVPAAAISAGFAWFLLHTMLGVSPWLAAPGAVVASLLGPRALLIREQRGAEHQFTESFPDALDTSVRMLRAGLPITSSLRFISTSAAPPISTVFATIADQAEIGIPVEEVLDSSSRELGLADFRFFAVAVVLQRATGGNLSSTLEILSDIIRKRRAIRLKVKAATAEVRISAYVLGALPLLAIGGLLVVDPNYLTPLFADPRGQLILAVAAGTQLLAALSMRLMIRRVTTI